jgi:hypothetical protein
LRSHVLREVDEVVHGPFPLCQQAGIA